LVQYKKKKDKKVVDMNAFGISNHVVQADLFDSPKRVQNVVA
jgi:hypothetical protein